MSELQYPSLTPDQRKKIEQRLINIFKDVYYNSPNILKAKSESDHISEEIKRFILSYTEKEQIINEVDLLLKAKEKGLELVESHELIFFDESLGKSLQMKAFLIPGMKIEFTEETAGEKVTEDDLQSLDHELCVSFKTGDKSEFVKLGNLLDIRATLAKALSVKSKDEKEVVNEINKNRTFKEALEEVYGSAEKVLSRL